jgi:hypothetical protein
MIAPDFGKLGLLSLSYCVNQLKKSSFAQAVVPEE